MVYYSNRNVNTVWPEQPMEGATVCSLRPGNLLAEEVRQMSRVRRMFRFHLSADASGDFAAIVQKLWYVVDMPSMRIVGHTPTLTNVYHT